MMRVHIRPSLPSATALLRSVPVPARILLFFLVFYVVLVQIARTTSYRDPSSVFFDPERGYQPHYSQTRSVQADAFIDQVNAGELVPTHASSDADICVGMATIARNGARYFRTAVGAALEGLSESERASLHLILFVAHSDPKQHPAYLERWLHEVADTVLLYDHNQVDMDHIAELEQAQKKQSGIEKGLFDYTYLLRACQATNASHVVILEDDVVALDGWLHRLREALGKAERQTAELGRSEYLYLRLFYTEEYLGWNSEEWPTYLFFALLTTVATYLVLVGIRQRVHSSRRFLSNESVLVITFVCTPLMIGLFFACGRVSMLPIAPGVHDMPRFGCCSQAFVFPQERVPDLIQFYESKRVGYVDMLTEQYADDNRELRWALTPVLVQHVGSKSSKADDFHTNSKYQRSVAERIWNFAFEMNDPEALRAEHRAQVELS